MKNHDRSLTRVLALALLVAAASGCVSVPKRNPPPAVDVAYEAEIPGLPNARFWGDEPPPWADRWYEMTTEEARALAPEVVGIRHTYLAISGGGAKGAFSAGLLNGWTDSGDRPEFQVVTGISTGALIAPFAFLGPEYDDVIKEVYTTVSTEQIVKKRNLINTFRSDAAASTEPLQALLEKYVDEAVMEAIAAEHRKGRALFIGTTNLDALRPVIWRIGPIADSGHPDALKLIRQILLASAALPLAMPPVLIEVEAGGQRYDELHVDGGVASQVFLYPMRIDWDRVLEVLAVPERPRVYVIRNSKLDPDWKATKNKLFSIMGRSTSSLIRTQGIGDLYQIYLATLKDELDFHLAFIPKDFDETAEESFDPVYMQKLYDLGYGMAKSGYPWITELPGLEGIRLAD
jgi:predicted acylesterase/phospholipase RssA